MLDEGIWKHYTILQHFPVSKMISKWIAKIFFFKILYQQIVQLVGESLIGNLISSETKFLLFVKRGIIGITGQMWMESED